jgi:3-oxoacyl-[acyl-carrier protein] reductase
MELVRWDFSNKCILVTGSTRGIGRSIAELLLEAGATVGIHGRNKDSVESICTELAPDTSSAIPVTGDFSEPEGARSVVETFLERTGKIDGLVNNAGGGKATAFRGITPEQWQDTFRVNLNSAVAASQAVYPAMRKQKAGNIVNIASLAAHGPGKWMGADYAASKAGLVSLTKSMAFESARLGIRVNAVSPGMIETDMTSALNEKIISGLNIPMQRLGKPKEVAEAVCFLLSDESAYITGQVLHVNGGLPT